MTNGSVNAVIEIRGVSSGCPYVTVASVKRSLDSVVSSRQNATSSDGLFMNTSLFWESTLSEVLVATQTESDLLTSEDQVKMSKPVGRRRQCRRSGPELVAK
jgi:hypothetical protein